jgi:MraZ protein
MEHSFSGSALCAVDRDGFVHLPYFIRAALERISGANALMIAPHEIDPCLVGYDRRHDQVLHAEQERLRLAAQGSDDHYARARRTFGWVEEGAYDRDGRIALPAMMRSKGRVEDLALFIGAGQIFEIWNPQVALESGDEALREIATWRSHDTIPPTEQEA